MSLSSPVLEATANNFCEVKVMHTWSAVLSVLTANTLFEIGIMN